MTKKPPAKSAKNAKRKIKPLTLHRLIGEMSFWGTFTRWLFLTVFAVLFVLFLTIVMSHVGSSAGSDLLSGLLIVLMVSIMFVFYDGLYVNMSRSVPISVTLDRVVLFGSEIVFAIAVVWSSVVTVPTFVIRGIAMAPIFATLILLLRLVLGIIGGKKSK